MRAELVLMGRRIDMAQRTHRRTLVVLIYAAFAILMAAFWTLDSWHTSGVYIVFATILVNRFFLGGYNTGGLVKPFSGKPPRDRSGPPPFLLLALRVYQPPLPDRDYESDERELRQRDRAHYQAYQGLAFALAAIWLLADWKMNAPRMLAWLHVPADTLLFALVMVAIVVALTLPQSILLWTEPDMEPADFSLE